MSKKVIIFDTSVLCVWLNVPGMEKCGTGENCWNSSRIDDKIKMEKKASSTFVLPLASIIETGNHIAQSSKKFETAKELGDLMRKSSDEETPWAAFEDQSVLWSPDRLKKLADAWPEQAKSGLSLGDATITDVAEHYSKRGCYVEIFTGDSGLKAYEPKAPESKAPDPRRRKR